MRKAASCAALLFICAALMGGVRGQGGGTVSSGTVCALWDPAADPNSLQAQQDVRLLYVPSASPLRDGCQPLVKAAFQDQATTVSGFGKLHVAAAVTAPATPPVTPAQPQPLLLYRAAGFAEGWLTAERTWHHFQNLRSYFQTMLYPGVDLFAGFPMQWLKQQEVWARQQASANGVLFNKESAATATTQPLAEELAVPNVWDAVQLMLAQFDGLQQGYAARFAHEQAATEGLQLGQLTREHHMFMQSNGELYDVVDAWLAGMIGPDTPTPSAVSMHLKSRHDNRAGKRAGAPTRGPEEWFRLVTAVERCSALVKVTGDLSDLFVGHATWDYWSQVLRIYKHYDLPVAGGYGRLSFSSYPGETFSDDDFYMSESGLVVVETTNHVFDPSVYASLSPESLLSWQRSRSALLLAASGREWVQLMSTANSGTYNNAWMVVDTNRFAPRQELQPGLLWLMEQLPGTVVALDVTNMLSHGYWAGYNVPFFQHIYNMSGYPDVITNMRQDQAQASDPAQKRDYELPIRWLQYQVSPRAALFRRDSAAAHDLSSFKALMRSNNYRHDPYSEGAPLEAICGRADLPPLPHPPHASAYWPHSTSSVDDHAHSGQGSSSSGSGGNVGGSNRRALKAQGQPGGAAAAISKSYDRRKLVKEPRGCYDGKVTSWALARQLVSEVVSGPTTSNGLPPFTWAAWPNISHVGQPETYNFAWERMDVADLPLE